MIALIGRRDDECLRLVHEAADLAGVQTTLVDTEDLASTSLAWDTSPTGATATLSTSEYTLELAKCCGIYARPLAPSNNLDFDAHRTHDLLSQWLDVAPGLVLNRPHAMRSNGSKPFQARTIARHGLAVPATLVTNDPAAVLDFKRRHGRVVYKSTSGIRSIVRELGETELPQLSRVSALPTQFQAYVEGTDVRVHVIGSRTFATRIRTDSVDYRYAGREGLEAELTACDLPDQLAAACVNVAQALELPLAGVDLRINADGEATCFEVNPMPAFSYYQAHTGQPIAAAIVEALVHHSPIADPSPVWRLPDEPGGSQ